MPYPQAKLISSRNRIKINPDIMPPKASVVRFSILQLNYIRD
jgi:hypothetical protein